MRDSTKEKSPITHNSSNHHSNSGNSSSIDSPKSTGVEMFSSTGSSSSKIGQLNSLTSVTASPSGKQPQQQSALDTSIEYQRHMAQKYANKPLRLGDKWYLVNADWYCRWCSFIGFDRASATLGATTSSSLSPGSIDNHALVERDNKRQLRDSVAEEIDYFTVCEELWSYWTRAYKLKQADTDVIERVVINDSPDAASGEETLRIEVRPLHVNLSCLAKRAAPTSTLTTTTTTTTAATATATSALPSPVVASSLNSSSTAIVSASKSKVVEMSRQTKLDQVIDKMRTLFEIPKEKEVRLYFKSGNDDKNIVLVDVNAPHATLSSAGYGVNETILLDVQDETGAWSIKEPLSKSAAAPSPPPPYQSVVGAASSTLQPVTTRHSTINTRSYDHSSSYSNRQGNDYKPGLCGLSNLGNTCFMNSSLQCMSNVPLLTDYFRDERYKKEINVVNPLGRKGEIAEAYADLVNEIWSGNNSYTIPRAFKLNLSRFAPQFTGFQQQDSHELLAFLLDGLHEDLNRIMKKPYVELGSHVGKTDEQFAEESWQDHKKRNDSIIVDLFHGLLKSTLNCLECGDISIKFDPFCYLSVPLPSKKERLVQVYFVPLDASQAILKLKLSVIKNGNVGDLCASLEQQLGAGGCPKSHMMVCDVYSNKFFKIFDSLEPLSSIADRDDIFIYELASHYSNPEYLKVKLHLKEKGSYLHSSSFMGLPLFFLVPCSANLTNMALYKAAFHHLKRFLKEANISSNEEINSKLSDTLNVNDEDGGARRGGGETMLSSQDMENSNSMSAINDDDQQQQQLSQQQSQQQLDDDSSSSSGGGGGGASVRSSQRLKNKLVQQSRIMHLVLCKSDNIESDMSQSSLAFEEQPFEYTLNKLNQSSSGISLIADFGSSSKRYYSKKPLDDAVEHPSCHAQLVKKKDVISLSDCFNLYTKVEELSEQDYWYCAKCKAHKRSTKKFDLWSMPPVLVVHLKRFSYSRLNRDKIDTLVDFPLKSLDMSAYMMNKRVGVETKYDLIAVSNHYGSLGGGHYTAFGKNRYDEKWYYFDDSCVTSSEESSVCTNAAYLLVYLRQDKKKELSIEKMDY